MKKVQDYDIYFYYYFFFMVVNVYNSSGFVKVYDYTKIDYICDNFKYFDPRSDFNESHNIYFFTITVSD
ncbi:MAG: hypothetical protein ACOC3V_03795, partial [bacterium]